MIDSFLALPVIQIVPFVGLLITCFVSLFQGRVNQRFFLLDYIFSLVAFITFYPPKAWFCFSDNSWLNWPNFALFFVMNVVSVAFHSTFFVYKTQRDGTNSSVSLQASLPAGEGYYQFALVVGLLFIKIGTFFLLKANVRFLNITYLPYARAAALWVQGYFLARYTHLSSTYKPI